MRAARPLLAQRLLARPLPARPLPARPLLVLLALLVLLCGAAPAAATGTGAADVARDLLRDPVHVADDAEADVDEDRVRRQVEAGSLPVYVAVLPARAARASGGDAALNRDIGQALGRRAVLITVAGTRATGGAAQGLGFQAGEADAVVRGAVQGSGDLTDGLVRAVRALQDASAGGGAQPAPAGGTGTGTGTGTGGGGGGAVLVVLLLVGLAAAFLYSRSTRTRRTAQMAGYRADITSLYDRLGADVSTLDPGDDPVARQALADAAERYNATGALLASSDTQGEYEAARRTVVEGLAATRLARQRLGLDPGPEVPPPPSEAPQLIRQEAVHVGDRELLGSPRYAPGRQHYWGGGMVGGSMVPGGWYGVNLQSMLIGGLLGNALSGGLGGGYGAGYREGLEDAGGFGGGGVFGGGGGDWGGGGGGDWGGGGGDWGGGGDARW